MDEINDFFDFSKEFHKVKEPKGILTSAPRPTGNCDVYEKPMKREPSSNDYIRKAVAAEEKKLSEFDPNMNVSVQSRMDMLSDDEDDVIPGKAEALRDTVYDTYNFDYDRDETLPIYEHREEIIKKIRASPVIILEGDTGCGKTTQVNFNS